LDPAIFRLPDILPTDSTPPRRTTLEADLYRDHVEKESLERGVIGAGIEARITRVVHARHYDSHAAPLTDLEYVLLGNGGETYLAHFITRPPDFDQIIGVTLDRALSDEELANGPRLTVPNRPNKLGDRLQEGVGPVSAILHSADGDVSVTVTPGVQFYCNSDRDMQ
jgi:hypothetical protein